MKRMMFIGLISLTAGSCIDPFNTRINDTRQALMVDGMITDQPGPYSVKLTWTLPITDQENRSPTVNDATVKIFDDAGASEILKETTAGVYQTQTIQGVVGRTYYISITTGDGFVYESIPEKMLAVGDISNVYQEFLQTGSPSQINPLVSPNGFNIYLDGTILPEQNGLVRWRWTGTFEIFTYPSLRRKVKDPQPKPPPQDPITVADPPLCSGWIVDPRDKSMNATIQADTTCTCCYCWVNEYNQVPLVSNRKFTNNNTVTKLNLGFIQATRRHFFNRYYLEVEQLSTSQVVYDFWKNVNEQKENGSNLFQTPPPKTVGNIVAKTDGAISPLGIFATAAVKKRSILLTRRDIPYEIKPIDTMANSCVLVYKSSVNTRPVFW